MKLRNILIQSLIAAALLTAIRAATGSAPHERSCAGRYQVAVGGEVTPCIVVIDTATGKAWRSGGRAGGFGWSDMGSPLDSRQGRP